MRHLLAVAAFVLERDLEYCVGPQRDPLPVECRAANDVFRRGLVASRGARLVTVIGSPGVGKTRLLEAFGFPFRRPAATN